MRTIFKSPMTTRRHRERGFCEDSDFATIELIELSAFEKQLIVSFREYTDNPKQEYIEHNGYAYKKIVVGGSLPCFGREKEAELIGNGIFYQDSALKIVLETRKIVENNFSCITNNSFILIGRTLYKEYCKIENLSITTSGNTMFSHWISINFESHLGKSNYPINKTSFKEVFKGRQKHWNDTKPKESFLGRADNHSHFSYPVDIVWGKKYLENKETGVLN